MVVKLLKSYLPPKFKACLHVLSFLFRNPSFVPLSFKIWKIFNAEVLGDDLNSAIKSSRTNRMDALELLALRKAKLLVDLLAAVHPKNPRCLPRVLALVFWMKKSNLPFQIKVGWRNHGIAHTWVEVNGQLLDTNPSWRMDTQEIHPVK